jgi:TonB-linked SusC/RagA family outer membrane protein
MRTNNFLLQKCLYRRKCFLLIIALLSVTVLIQAQNVSLSKQNVKLSDLFEEIEKQTNLTIAYNESTVDVNQTVSVNVKNKPVVQVMNDLLKGAQATCKLQGKQILIVPEPQKVAQDRRVVSGIVSDTNGEPMIGANVVVKGTTNGNITDVDGKFSLDVSPGATLVVSFIGYLSQEITIGNQTNLKITLAEDNMALDEVVVVAYGTQKKRDLTGSVATIPADVLEAATGATNFASMMQGQAAGASIQTSSGRLGAEVDVKIRGLSSISASTSPLWIIDGVPMATSIDAGGNYSASQSPMSLINPADIESIQILKDAAATSIYGSRGSNGVIMVTTKSGTQGKFTVNVDYSTGISNLPLFHSVDFVNTQQWFQMADEMKQAYGLGRFEMTDHYSTKFYSTEFLTREQAEKINTNWRKETMRQGNFQNVNFSTMGGDKSIRYFVSGNYRKDKGVMTNDDFERFGVRANIDVKPSDYFEIGTKINLSMSKSNRGKNDGGQTDDGNKNGTTGGFSYVHLSTTPFEPVYSQANPAEYYNPYAGNPAAYSDPANLVEDLDVYRVLSNVYGVYAFPFLKELSARAEVSVDFVQSNRNFWVSDVIRYDGSLGQDGASTSKTFNYNLFLTYNKTFGEHGLNVVGGSEAQQSDIWLRRMSGELLTGSYQELGSPNKLTNMYSRLSGESYLLSYFGRANYKFKERYLAGLSIRKDGSSVFTSDYRWGTFTALSLGWILSEESFMGDFGEKHFLKVRGSYGKTGNANIPPGLDISQYHGDFPYGDQGIMAINGTAVKSIGVSNLRWESTNNLDFGLDFGFFANRINGSVAYYNKYVKDLLLATELPYSSGVSSIYGNIGDLENSGIELSVTSDNLKSKKLRWQTSFNIAYNHNEVKKLTPQIDQNGRGMVSDRSISKTGYGVRDYYMADFAYVDPQTGISQIYVLDTEYYEKTGETRRLQDAAGNDVVQDLTSSSSNNNRFHFKNKNLIPKYYGGITNKLSYQSFDFGFLITFSGGDYFFDEQFRNIALMNSRREFLDDVYLNYWKKPGDQAKYQRLTWNGNIQMEDGSLKGLGDLRNVTDQFLFKGDYVKLKSVTLGYTTDKIKCFRGFRIYAMLENLYTLSNYPGWDPEGYPGTGNGRWDLPPLFSATLGLSIKF